MFTPDYLAAAAAQSSRLSANYDQERLRREVNVLIKEIGQIKKNKGDATDLLAKKVEIDKKVAEGTAQVAELQKKRDVKAMQLGNIVDKNSAVSMTEVSSQGPHFIHELTLNRTITQSCESGTQSPITRETPNLDCRSRTRRRVSFRTTRF